MMRRLASWKAPAKPKPTSPPPPPPPPLLCSPLPSKLSCSAATASPPSKAQPLPVTSPPRLTLSILSPYPSLLLPLQPLLPVLITLSLPLRPAPLPLLPLPKPPAAMAPPLLWFASALIIPTSSLVSPGKLPPLLPPLRPPLPLRSGLQLFLYLLPLPLAKSALPPPTCQPR